MRDFKEVQGSRLLTDKAVICGLGDSIREINQWAPKKNIFKIGVNDIQRIMDVDYIVMVDPMKRFNSDRQHHIMNSGNKCPIITQQSEVKMQGIDSNRLVKINLRTERGADISSYNSICVSYTSIFTAVAVAYWMNFRQIGIIGCDLVPGEHHLTPMNKEMGLHFKKLHQMLSSMQCKLYNLSSRSFLNDYIPFMTPEEFYEKEYMDFRPDQYPK